MPFRLRERLTATISGLEKGVDMSRQTLTMREAIQYLGMTRRTILRFIQQGRLRFINTGLGELYPRYYFLYTELDRFLEDMQTSI